MLSANTRQAIIGCLTEPGNHARNDQLPLLAALIHTPALNHPDSTARYLQVSPLPVPAQIRAQAAGPADGLRHAAAELHTSSVQTQLAGAPQDLHLVAWVFTYTDDHPLPARVIAAVDIDNLSYRHTTRTPT